MAVQLLINGIDRSASVKMGTLSIRDQINQATDVCDFEVDVYGDQTFKPQVNDEVIVRVDTVRSFGGVIVDVEQSMVGHARLNYRVQCKDWSQHLDRRLVTERFESTDDESPGQVTLHDVVVELIDKYGDDYGFTTTNVKGTTFPIASVSFNELPLSECFNKLARLTGYSWYVDYNKDIHFFKKNDEPAPFNLSDTSDNFIYDSLVIRSDFSQIRNRVKIRGGEARAEERTKKWKGDGETDVFGTDHKFAEKPRVFVDGVEKTVGVDFLNQDEDFECMWSFAQKYIRFTAGNIPGEPVGSEVTNIDITGIPLKPIVVQRQHNPSVVEYGLYEFVKYNDSLKTRDEALQFAAAELEIYADSIRAGSFETYTAGLKSGQTIRINSSVRGIDEEFLIQSVSFRQVSANLFVWRVEIATLRTLGMIDILQKLILEERISEGEDETLLNFFALSDAFSMGDALGDITVTTSEDYYIEQDDPESDTLPNPAVVNKSTISA